MKKSVLSDHKQIKKKFIPPLLDFFSNSSGLTEVSWLNSIIPEIIWITLLNEKYGIKRGAELSLLIAKIIKSKSKKKICFGFTSSLEKISKSIKKEIIDLLKEKQKLKLFQDALRDLIFFYPEIPFNFLIDIKTNKQDVSINIIKNAIINLMDPLSFEATMSAGNVIYIAFVTDMLKVTSNCSLSKFPELEKYPNTELSKQIAASVRNSIKGFLIAPYYNKKNQWCNYFWNRGLEIEKCQI